MSPIYIRPASPQDRPWIERQLRASWGATLIVRRDERLDAAALPALLAVDGGEIVGLATFRIDLAPRGNADGRERQPERECECVTLDALIPRRGIGSTLLAELAVVAAGEGCRRLWLVTTNDNLAALRFYQRRGLRLVGVASGAVDRARAMKPTIPELGHDGIPIHDELELELELRLAPSG